MAEVSPAVSDISLDGGGAENDERASGAPFNVEGL